MTLVLNNIEENEKCTDFIVNIEATVDFMSVFCFSIRCINKDQFTSKKYEIKKLTSSYIIGCEIKWVFPGGLVMYAKKNKILMDCANIYFMVKYNIIPIMYTNLEILCKVKRSNGTIQTAAINPNDAIKYFSPSFQKKRIGLNLNFYQDDSSENEKYFRQDFRVIGDSNKFVSFVDHMKTNNIQILTIKLYSLDKTIYEEKLEAKNIHPGAKNTDKVTRNEKIINTINYYNELLKKWIYEELIIMFTSHNEYIPVEIYLDGACLFSNETFSY